MKLKRKTVVGSGSVLDDYFKLREENKMLREEIITIKKHANVARERMKYQLDDTITVVIEGLEAIRNTLKRNI
jgi:hypothetical protein